MLNLNHNDENLLKAFNLSFEDWSKVVKHWDFLGDMTTSQNKTVTWLINRTWIDETLSDNAKCFTIFNIGRLYQDTNRRRQ